ncbi:helix-turn-helix domain-containing protein [Paraburkholderia phenazinium]|uniref:helix-turn-helix domain-containing protein n=2 Tax=Burkholderiaceae TaxID=119060 RepID=UPI001588709C|nr:helix-turn-helix transcriptional regulator [Paraburkholderia phenazinium]
MRDHHDAAATISKANILRQLLSDANLGQREAARLLGVEERTMRQWCSGQGTPPPSVFRALSPRLTHLEVMQRAIDSNDSIIAAIAEGRITGLGYGPVSGGPDSALRERARLERKNQELRALLRLQQAFDRKQRAFFALSQEALPHGNGVLTESAMDEVDAAEAEFRAAQLEVDRISQEIRDGHR